MRIGTIGAGAVALAVAREALARGHEIVLSSRSGPGALADKVSELGRGAWGPLSIGARALALAVAREALARGHEIVLSSRSGPDAPLPSSLTLSASAPGPL